ncbi:hypothetical protein AB0H88_37965 [Nonomuraea sp. NPDC050680]|uniref:hypothetical protein n=1 Tax=Nonomuraea sp. NPDC050680 TaxID=3154630 RepID=UPI0034105214
MPIYAYTCGDGSEVSLSWYEGAITIKGRFAGDPYREFGIFAVDLQGNLQCDEGARTADN